LEPLFKERTAVRLNNVETGKGALFRYRKKPYLFDAKYTDDTIQTTIIETMIKTFSADASYFKEFKNAKILSVTGGFIPRSFSDSTGLSGDSQEYNLSSLFRNHRLNLNSSLSKLNFDQEEPIAGNLSSDQFSWLELLTIHLLDSLRSDMRYRYQK